MRNIRVIVFLWILLLIPVSLFSQEEESLVVLGCERSFLTAPVWVSLDNGYFQEEGLSLVIKGFETGKASLEAMLRDDQIHICTVAQTPIVFHSFSRNDIAIIGVMVYSEDDVKILTRRGNGIRQSIDLKGKTIGVSKGTTGQFFLNLFLNYQGLLYSQVNAVDLKPSEMVDAIINNKVDAICTWEPHIITAKHLLKEDGVVLPSNGLYREDFYFVTTQKFIKNNAKLLVKFLKAIQKGQMFIQDNKEVAIDMVSKKLNLDKQQTQEVWDIFTFRLLLDQSVLTSLEEEARWVIREGLTDKKTIPNYLKFIYTHALEAVNPDMVTIIHQKYKEVSGVSKDED